MYRAIEETAKGMQKASWFTQEGKPDHFAHATCYQRIALLKTLSYGGVVLPPSKEQAKSSIFVRPDNTTAPPVSFNRIVEGINRPRAKNWKYS